MTLRNSVVPAALALAGCFPTESEPPPALEQVTYHTPIEGGECEVEDVVHHLHGEIVQDGVYEKSALRRTTLIVSVGESTSVVDCDSDLMKVAMPGAELLSAAVTASLDGFDIDVPAVVIGGHRPSIWVHALLDENDNGECDEGEAVGTAELEESELGDFAIELSREGCPTRH